MRYALKVGWLDVKLTQEFWQSRAFQFFIGDFGNNDNERKDLTIYKIENPVDLREFETEAEIIRFKFTDQDFGNTNDSIKNFDLEAFIFYEGRLYLFTKNSSNSCS